MSVTRLTTVPRDDRMRARNRACPAPPLALSGTTTGALAVHASSSFVGNAGSAPSAAASERWLSAATGSPGLDFG